jgi:hypothetical protein
MEVDWTYSSKRSHNHRKPGPALESSRTNEESKAKDVLEKNWGRGNRKSKRNMEGSTEYDGAALLKPYAPERSNRN